MKCSAETPMVSSFAVSEIAWPSDSIVRCENGSLASNAANRPSLSPGAMIGTSGTAAAAERDGAGVGAAGAAEGAGAVAVVGAESGPDGRIGHLVGGVPSLLDDQTGSPVCGPSEDKVVDVGKGRVLERHDC